MTDRDLFEAAAKAAGNGAEWYQGLGMGINNGGPFPTLWNPRDDDGDAFRLLAALPSLWTLKVKFGNVAELSVAWGAGLGIVEAQAVHDDTTRAKAMRLAIFRAAAAIGRTRVLVTPNV